jgi:hypothetical protein
VTPAQEDRLRARTAVLIIAGWCWLCVLASLSGCLTAAKIGQWQRAVYGWGMDEAATQACRDASALASKYIAKSNTDLLGTGRITDLSSDSRARELVTSAALACGKEAP